MDKTADQTVFLFIFKPMRSDYNGTQQFYRTEIFSKSSLQRAVKFFYLWSLQPLSMHSTQ